MSGPILTVAVFLALLGASAWSAWGLQSRWRAGALVAAVLALAFGVWVGLDAYHLTPPSAAGELARPGDELKVDGRGARAARLHVDAAIPSDIRGNRSFDLTWTSAEGEVQAITGEVGSFERSSKVGFKRRMRTNILVTHVEREFAASPQGGVLRYDAKSGDSPLKLRVALYPAVPALWFFLAALVPGLLGVVTEALATRGDPRKRRQTRAGVYLFGALGFCLAVSSQTEAPRSFGAVIAAAFVGALGGALVFWLFEQAAHLILDRPAKADRRKAA